MYLPQLDLSAWHTVLLGLAVQQGCEAAAILFVSTLAGRPWRDRILAAAPFAAFVWLSLAARNVRAQIDFWSHYLAFQHVHYSPGYSSLVQQTQQEYAGVVESANRFGWASVLVAICLVLLYSVLLAHWFAPPHKRDAKLAFPSAASGDEVEFLVEPLEHPRGT